ncbi:uncharacterized protein AMSG_10684 [Thecamonas trahens ATCC 50062]|uniref:SHSP domain-containing protein n=1 Tax=Thecamonas trahens ATCC 50062 TaxID=461836 RepID=A0A0L0DSA0_THETB|nr:hypothetical protein AMSG_10684 [Thecamonas trahens ATCC 50062]KNC55087.1 hypothetical protein AMSG_10684 [Thecamonas trahens ATCC 50062]|eukprot:XP_013753271.1 hypothetical protein AMSG_10684 [Thecamonas trahens ATCC 50062]
MTDWPPPSLRPPALTVLAAVLPPPAASPTDPAPALAPASATPVGTDEGFLSTLWRVTPSSPLPSPSLIVKHFSLAASPPLAMHAREMAWYSAASPPPHPLPDADSDTDVVIAPSPSAPSLPRRPWPARLGGTLHRPSGTGILVLEDRAPARPPSLADGLPPDALGSIAAALAIVHLDVPLPGPGGPIGPLADSAAFLGAQIEPGLDWLAARLAPEPVAALRAWALGNADDMPAAASAAVAAVSAAASTAGLPDVVCHGDLWCGNILLDPVEPHALSVAHVTFVDFQFAVVAPAVYDLAMIAATSLGAAAWEDPVTRASAHAILLDAYVTAYNANRPPASPPHPPLAADSPLWAASIRLAHLVHIASAEIYTSFVESGLVDRVWPAIAANLAAEPDDIGAPVGHAQLSGTLVASASKTLVALPPPFAMFCRHGLHRLLPRPAPADSLTALRDCFCDVELPAIASALNPGQPLSHITAHLPQGMDDVSLGVKDRTLTITGRDEATTTSGSPTLKTSTEFTRFFPLPKGVEFASLKASTRGDLFRITIPKPLPSGSSAPSSDNVEKLVTITLE